MTSYIKTETTSIVIKQSPTGHGLTCFSMDGIISGYYVYAWGQFNHEQGRVMATPEMKFEVTTKTGRYAHGKKADQAKAAFRKIFWNFQPATN